MGAPGRSVSAGGFGPSAPMGLSGRSPAFLSAFRGLMRSPFAEFARQGQQPLAPPAFGRFGPETPFDDEEMRRRQASIGPAFLGEAI